jgi:acyl-CoA reductase-like NAD-dependent aldehyde dehydrogenase
VHASLFDRFVDAYVEQVKRHVVGNPLDAATTVGPVVDAKAAAAIRAQVQAAIDAGARSCIDPSHFDVPDLSPCYLAPAVLTNVDHKMAVMREETFGPAIGIMKVDDDERAITLMNDSQFGLTGSIWTADAERALTLATRVEAGTVYQNRADYLDPGLCWTGVKDSGFGCSLSDLGFLSVTRPKSFHLRTTTPGTEG